MTCIPRLPVPWAGVDPWGVRHIITAHLDVAVRTYRGVDGMMKAWSVWAEPWDELRTEIEWVRDAGADRVVSCHRARMRGKGSGVEGERRYAYL